jgi:hypothetical protein
VHAMMSSAPLQGWFAAIMSTASTLGVIDAEREDCAGRNRRGLPPPAPWRLLGAAAVRGRRPPSLQHATQQLGMCSGILHAVWKSLSDVT